MILNLNLNLNLAFELESKLQDTLDSSRKWLISFNTEKIQLASIDWFSKSGTIDAKWMVLLFRKNHL